MAVLKIGSKGSPVKKLQEQLNKAGAKPKLDPDGAFGKKTAEAVKAVQKAKGLKPDGVVGKKTEAALSGKGGGAKAGDAKAGGNPKAGKSTGSKSTSGNESGGKGGGKVPKEVVEKLHVIKKLLYAHKGDCEQASKGIEKTRKEIQNKESLSDKDKAKYIKPLDGLVSKSEKSQSRLAATLQKNRSLLAGVDPKAAGGSAKKLSKLDQDLAAAAKNYVSGSKTSRKRGSELLDKLAKGHLRSMNNVSGRFNEIYLGSSHGRKLFAAWQDFYDAAKKAA